MAVSLASASVRSYLPWLLAMIGGLLVVALSSVATVDSVGVGATLDDQELTLGGIATLGQPLAIVQPDLAGVAIWMNTQGQAEEGLALTIRLRYVGGLPINLVEQSVPVSAANGGVLIVRWAPISPARNPLTTTEQLYLLIDIPELPPGGGPTIAARKNPEGQGRLMIDGTAKPGLDLAIAPLYQRRWADSLWPISAMAAGKPGLFGWPPLYPLLAYLFLIALVAGLAALWRARPRDG